MNNLLDVKNLCKSFSIRNGFRNEILRAVQNVSFQMYSNKPSILAIAGESGSGKSTIAKLILGLEKISSGSIHFKGRDISQISKREKIGIYDDRTNKNERRANAKKRIRKRRSKTTKRKRLYQPNGKNV